MRTRFLKVSLLCALFATGVFVTDVAMIMVMQMSTDNHLLQS